MSEQLTDETLAKALGWILGEGDLSDAVVWRREDGHYQGYLPKYTTSIDVIAQEIERRGDKCKQFCISYMLLSTSYDKPLDLFDPKQWCKALMAYPEEQ